MAPADELTLVKKYKNVDEDQIDQKLQKVLKSSSANLNVKKSSLGKYKLGNKIMIVRVKVSDDNLAIRIGGCFMDAAAFLNKYG